MKAIGFNRMLVETDRANKTEIKHTFFNHLNWMPPSSVCMADHGGHNIHTHVYYINVARVKNWCQGEGEWSLSCYQAMKLWITHDFLVTSSSTTTWHLPYILLLRLMRAIGFNRKLTGPIRLRLNIHLPTIWTGCWALGIRVPPSMYEN